MASPYSYAWADLQCYPGVSSLSSSIAFVDGRGHGHRHGKQKQKQKQQNTRVFNPTKPQPFTELQNVSPDASHAGDQGCQHDMARQDSPSGPLSAVASYNANVNLLQLQDACNMTEHCMSPPCDKADCDEATICYDHDHPAALMQHDFHCTDHLQCPDSFNCDDATCNFDWLCTDLSCQENDCQQDHSQLCATACSDPSCQEENLYCCLSDICPHRPHTDCPEPCVDQCLHPHPNHVCHVPPPAACNYALPRAPSTLTVSQDAMSCSSISTPNTEPTESVATPDHFQTLIEAASILPPPPGLSLSQSIQPPRKRMRTDEASPLIHDFHVPFYTSQEYWPFDFQSEYPPTAVQTKPQPLPVAVSTTKNAIRQSTSPRSSDEIPQCRWQDDITGTCGMKFSTIEELHNHVKEHTGQLVPSKNSNRNFICRWQGCEKAAPFGTKNHLDRHMQNHTRFKPFACSVCGHRCVTQQQLNNHLTTHSREKKFKCDFPGCNKVFGVKTALSTHKRTHTNEKPFSCRWCGDSYSDSSNLSKHRKTVHEDDKTAIPCPEPGCAYKDSRAQRLERHCRDAQHGLNWLGDTHKWSEYTRKKQVRSRTASVAPSNIAV